MTILRHARKALRGAVLAAPLFVISGSALAADTSFEVNFEGAVEGSFSSTTKAENPPVHEFRHFYDGTNAEGPYELEFNSKLAPVTVFGDKGRASIHFTINRPLDAGSHEIGDAETEDTPVSVTVYSYQSEGDLGEDKLWFTGNADGNFVVESMSSEQVSGRYQFTIENTKGTDTLTATGRFTAIPYEVSPDISIEQTGAFEFPDDPPHFNKNSATSDGDNVVITLSQKWGFTLEFNVPASATVGETLPVGNDKPVSGVIRIRGQEPMPMQGTFTLRDKGEYVGATFDVTGRIKGKQGGFNGEFAYVPVTQE